jgi:hypothetical protein
VVPLVQALHDALLERHELAGPETADVLYLTAAAREPTQV